MFIGGIRRMRCSINMINIALNDLKFEPSVVMPYATKAVYVNKALSFFGAKPTEKTSDATSNINIQHVDTERQQGLSCASSSKNANDVKNDGADVHTIPMIDDYEELTLEQEFMKYIF
ncbi:hypothetical protein DYB35_006362 [Aphanomyces astaci]|uniref:Uncharacterized protein n=2 Tax=Aphanomyces astaci TaxID=112090 RepID=A0A397CFP3_APHAT|nr:hypothetical protein DYB30_012685 [Aphanomyces astaci]RHY45495.1 hypothetical protein DYB38_011090 [Aphanomyces astaci]RHY96557.1 hypothetical protein DYB35_006362 [Aphanomyces astaci]